MMKELIKKTTNMFKEKRVGEAEIQIFELSEEDARFAKRKALFSHTYDEFRDFSAGKYVRLLIANKLVMSNTPMEIRTNSEFIAEAKGDVFIGGLGLGIIIMAIAEKKEVKSITVVEQKYDVIKLIKPILKNLGKKITIIEGDVFSYKTDKKFDILYFDIWETVSGENYDEMKALTKMYRSNKIKGGKIMHWRKNDCRKMYNDDRYYRTIYRVIGGEF